ncbi:efflux RND transporter periplasmic adaptor subunit [Sphingobium yanoikuyae]|nr:efflux RND transporter periplasmic adaptor subunit [Sphingobium yanoikuyae]
MPVGQIEAIMRSAFSRMSPDAVGSLRAVREVTLSPEVAGRVSAIHFEAGGQVGSGALLVQLFDGPERADRRAAQAKAAFAGIQVARSQELAPTGAEPRETLEQRRADRDQAAAAVQQIDARLIQKQVRAPFAGVLGIRRINLGQYLNPGDAVATLTALDNLFVDFALPQQELNRLKPGSTVIVTSDAWPGRRFTAMVNAIEPKIGEDTRNVTVQALLPNGDRALRPGMYVTAALELPLQQGALLVPATAIQTSAQGDSIIVIRGSNARVGGRAEIVPVQTGRRVGNDVVVTSGLRAGDVIVTEGQLRVQPGAEVKIAGAIPAKQGER